MRYISIYTIKHTECNDLLRFQCDIRWCVICKQAPILPYQIKCLFVCVKFWQGIFHSTIYSAHCGKLRSSLEKCYIYTVGRLNRTLFCCNIYNVCIFAINMLYIIEYVLTSSRLNKRIFYVDFTFQKQICFN